MGRKGRVENLTPGTWRVWRRERAAKVYSALSMVRREFLSLLEVGGNCLVHVLREELGEEW